MGDADWVWEKWLRSLEHQLDLAREVEHWRANMDLKLDAHIAEDRLSWDVTGRIGNWPPPTEHWGLVFGDAVHNLRSVLDVMVWALADRSTLSERQLTDLQFPLVQDSARWQDAQTRRLAGLRADQIQRIREVQPFNASSSDDARRDALVLIHALDIQDKHRQAVHTRPVFAEGSISNQVEFDSPESAERNLPPNWWVDESSTADGVIRAGGSTLDPIAGLKGGVTLSANLLVQSPVGDIPMLGTLRELSEYVAQIVAHVSGTPPTFALPLGDTDIEARWPHRA